MKAGSRVLLYAEWPRKGWDETEYTLDVYRTIFEAAKGSRIVPVGRVWDAYYKQDPGVVLWMQDGNHAQPLGSFLAACCIAHFVSPLTQEGGWHPTGVAEAQAWAIRTLVKKSFP